MFIKILNTCLVLIAVFMALKQGWSMLNTKPEMMIMFGKWNIGKTGVIVFGLISILSALLILFPQTFLAGNFLMAATILLIICFQISVRNLRGAAIEIPFMLLNLIIIYFQHPLKSADRLA